MPDVSKPSFPPVPETPIAVIVVAKLPVPGSVKTRLCPPCTSEEAADVALASLLVTLDVVGSATAANPDLFGAVYICVDRLGLDAPEWLTRGGTVFDQCSGHLGERLAHAFRTVNCPAILIGMDTPQVTEELLVDAARLLRTSDSVIGPASDGGFWLIGMHRPHPEAFHGVPMSAANTGHEQVRALQRLGLAPAFLRPLTDLDVFDDAVAISALIPGSRVQIAVERISARLDRYSRNETHHTKIAVQSAVL